MRDGNADLVSAAFDAWNRRDLRALLALCEPDVEVRSLMTEAERATYSGSRGVSDWLAAVIDVFPTGSPSRVGSTTTATPSWSPST